MGENGMVMTVPLAAAALGAAVVYWASAQTPKPAPALAGTSWQLVKFQGGDDTTLTPADRSKYTIEFGPDGFVTARIDCNRGRGSWTSPAPRQLRLGPLALTRAMCPPGSLHDRIVKHWDYIRSYVLKDGHLFLSLMADGGIYVFEPVVAGQTPVAGQTGGTVVKGTATFRERMALPPKAVFEAQLEDVSRMDAPAEVVARTEIKSLGNPPFSFEIPYDPARIQSSHSYSVRARILVGGKVVFTTDTSYPVLTRGKSDTVSLLLRRAASSPPKPTQASSGGRPLEKTYWKATLVGSTTVTGKDSQSEPHLVLGPGRRFAGSDGCNRLTGSYELKGETITFSKIGGTMMACPDTAGTERAFKQALPNTRRWNITGDGLELYDADGTRLARFEARDKP
jgi:putative lipoprotein